MKAYAIALLAVLATPAKHSARAETVEELCPCDDATSSAAYVSCVTRACNKLIKAGEITKAEKKQFKNDALQSECGKKLLDGDLGRDKKCELPEGKVKNCARYFEDSKGEVLCQYCAAHYEIDSDGECSPCVVCSSDLYGTRDFCPIANAVWGGVTPHKEDGTLVTWPKTDQDVCDKFVKWGAAGYDAEDPEAYYCKDTRDHPVAWVYNYTVDQTESDYVDGVSRQVIWVKSGEDEDYRIPARPVYACQDDTIIAQMLNVIDPEVVNGAAYPDGEAKLGFTIHWHGMLQLNNQHMDGVAMVSQCPIGNQGNNTIPCTTQYNDPDGNDFSYTYRADPGGTYWWHSHSGLQYGDGLVGSLIVFQKPEDNPYHDDYDVDLAPLLIGDWWHELSQTLVVNLFYGAPEAGGSEDNGFPNTDTVCEKNRVKCTPQFTALSASAFNCICAGGASDYPYVSGYFNGDGQFPEITTSTTREEALTQKFHEVSVMPGKRYRMRITNSGFNFGLRFSIDSHDFSVIAADGQFQEEVKDVSHFVTMPGERYDIIIQAKTEEELGAIGGEQFFMRAATYNDTYWDFNTEQDGWEMITDDSYHTMYAVLNYDSGSTKDIWFAEGSKLSMDLQEPAPLPTKVVDVSMWWNENEWAPWGSPEVVDELKGFRFPGAVPGCTEPVHNGKGPLGAPFGCDSDGMPLPIPKPDLLINLWVNGIMYPAYNLFLAKSDPLDYAEYTANETMWNSALDKIGEPNMYARSEIPLSYTRGEYGLRNLDVWGPSPDSPGWNPEKNAPRGEWGSQTKYNYGNGDEPSNAFFPDGHGVTNLTEMIYLPKNKWVMVIQRDGGPMTHPFHIHGYDTFILARDANVNTTRPRDAACNVDTSEYGAPDRVPLYLNPECKRSAANYMNGYGAELIPPTAGRHQPMYTYDDLNNPSKTNWYNPSPRDMPVVPPHGYVVWMFYTDNPGAWFYHCHLEFHAGLGMGLTWMVGADGDDWLDGNLKEQQIGAFNQGNCKDVEFEGPIQFY